jgi:hypothetical protein
MWCNLYVVLKNIVAYNIKNKLESVNMFLYDLKLWKNFKMKHKIWQHFCTFKNFYFSKFDSKKTYDILGQL